MCLPPRFSHRPERMMFVFRDASMNTEVQPGHEEHPTESDVGS